MGQLNSKATSEEVRDRYMTIDYGRETESQFQVHHLAKLSSEHDGFLTGKNFVRAKYLYAEESPDFKDPSLCPALMFYLQLFWYRDIHVPPFLSVFALPIKCG